MKKLNNLFLALAFLPFPLFSQIDTLYQKYRASENMSAVSTQFKIDYNLNGDSIIDFSKIYSSKKDSLGNLGIPEYPSYYIFYSNEKGTHRVDVVIYDEKADGMNGNEEFLFIRPKKKKPKKITL